MGGGVDLEEEVIKIGPEEPEFSPWKAFGFQKFGLDPAVNCESLDSQVFAGGGCVKPWIVIRIGVGICGVRFHVGVTLSSGPPIIPNMIECTERGGNHCFMHNSLRQLLPRCTKAAWSGLRDAHVKQNRRFRELPDAEPVPGQVKTVQITGKCPEMTEQAKCQRISQCLHLQRFQPRREDAKRLAGAESGIFCGPFRSACGCSAMLVSTGNLSPGHWSARGCGGGAGEQGGKAGVICSGFDAAEGRPVFYATPSHVPHEGGVEIEDSSGFSDGGGGPVGCICQWAGCGRARSIRGRRAALLSGQFVFRYGSFAG